MCALLITVLLCSPAMAAAETYIDCDVVGEVPKCSDTGLYEKSEGPGQAL